MSKKAYQTSWSESKKKWKDTLTFKRQKIAESNNKSLPLKDKKLPSSNSFSDSKEESLNSKCKWEAMHNDFKNYTHLSIKI